MCVRLAEKYTLNMACESNIIYDIPSKVIFSSVYLSPREEIFRQTACERVLLFEAQ